MTPAQGAVVRHSIVVEASQDKAFADLHERTRHVVAA